MRLNKRGVMFVTDLCNMKCKFCYYAYSNTPKSHRAIDDLKRLADILRFRYDLTHVDLTGKGEPTLYPHLKEIVKYCDDIGLKPTVITNGQRADVIKELIEDGHLEDVVLSIHSVEKAYEELTRGKWEKLLETLKILKETNFNWRGNVCVVKDNLPFLIDTIELVHKYGGRLLNFLVFNPHENTDLAHRTNEIQAKYSECAEAMKKAIDRANELGVMIEVRYIPICTMKGYEKYVLNFSQWIYDPYSWEEAHGNALPPFKEEYEAVEFVRQKTLVNYKKDKCENCSNRDICDGVYPQYIKRFGEKEFEPFTGPLLINPLHYRIKYMEEHPNAYSEDKW